MIILKYTLILYKFNNNLLINKNINKSLRYVIENNLTFTFYNWSIDDFTKILEFTE